jgi:putative membrane protein insertion efficiency factor
MGVKKLFLICSAFRITFDWSSSKHVRDAMKTLIIKLIRLYQKFAPGKLRNSCRFIPTCSEYTILALEKYGLVSGLKKGVYRIYSCKAPNGGYDYP